MWPLWKGILNPNWGHIRNVQQINALKIGTSIYVVFETFGKWGMAHSVHYMHLIHAETPPCVDIVVLIAPRVKNLLGRPVQNKYFLLNSWNIRDWYNQQWLTVNSHPCYILTPSGTFQNWLAQTFLSDENE